MGLLIKSSPVFPRNRCLFAHRTCSGDYHQFELAKYFGGVTNLRFDDTNPTQEDVEFVDAIQKDIEWLGYKPNIVVYGSSYFDATYEKRNC